MYFIFVKRESVEHTQGKASGRYKRYIPRMEILYRMAIFLNILSCALAVIYALGNFQYFLDSTQIFILKLLAVGSLADFFLAFLVIVQETVSAARKKYRLRLSLLFTSVFFLLSSLFFLLCAHVLIKLSEGF